MYIKQIEFTNFKSFGKKVKIPFFDDFTTISGPNGSGKSNIIDGILFALGLSSSRTMRAEKLTDLIYNDGNKNKRPDFAQVSIFFDNTDREMPVDTDQITITRKIRETDSGYYSYFYFNGKPVSLSDVHNILSKARVTPEGYNVVMQGDVTRIITMTPTERRKIIDEIAGVSEFDNRKERALNELEIVRERIERVDIIIDEVGIQLEKLRGERDQALKYRSLRQEKMKYEGFVLLSKLKDARSELTAVKDEADGRKGSLEELHSLMEQASQKLETAENELEELTETIRKMGEDEQIQIKKDIEEIRGEISRCSGSIELTESEIEDIDSRRRKVFVEIDEDKNRINELESQVSENTLRKESLNDQIGEHRTEYRLVMSKIAEIDSKFASTRDELSSLKSELEDLKNRKSELLREEDRLLDALRRRSAEVREIENEIDDAKSKVESSDSDTRSIKYEIEKLTEKINTLTQDMDDLESNRSQIKKVVTELEDTLRKYQQEYALVEARVRAAEDSGNYSKAVDIVLDARKKKVLPGIYGTIAELGKVDQKYATALEIAAGGRMQAVVVETDEDGAGAIDYLKSRRGGRATFLPLNRMEARRPYKNLSDREGVVGYAIDLIDFDPRFEAAFWYVFRDTLVVDTLKNARRLMGGLRMVTLDGETIEKSGAMTGGSRQSSRLSFAAAEKEKLVKLAEQITEYDSRRNTALKKMDSVEAHISSTSKEIDDLEKMISRKEMQLEEIAGRGERLAGLIESRNRELEEIGSVQKELREQMDAVVSERNGIEENIKSLTDRIENLEMKLSSSQIPEFNNRAESIDEEIKRLEDRVRDIDSQINALRLDHDYAQKKIEDNRNLIKDLEDRKSEYRDRIVSLGRKIEELESLLTEKQNKESQISENLSEARKRREQKQSEYRNIKSEFEAARSRFEDAQREMTALESTRDALTEQISELVTELERRGVEETDDVPGYEAVRTRIASIERAMEKMEPVNMRAIEEYDNVESRLAELEQRRDVLFNEREEILIRINQYEKFKKEAFMDSYNGINEHFKTIFNELSDGRGELVLDNYEDPFSGGLTLKAQPKDKTLQRLEAMSGGEKSLTALAFVFAIQQYRPAPFYAFDEIDMFLDGSNAEKVAQRIKKSGTYAQFIVVSLRKPMIEAASRTIGVAMQDNNITSITGVKLR